MNVFENRGNPEKVVNSNWTQNLKRIADAQGEDGDDASSMKNVCLRGTASRFRVIETRDDG